MEMYMTLLVENGRIYINGSLMKKSVLIEDGKIKSISSSRTDATDEVINAKGMIILPGFIDPHVHFREPGMTHKEDFRSGSFAAATGGVTCFIDMPNTKPPTLTTKLLDEKRKYASEKSIVDFGFHFGSSDGNLEEIKNAKRIASVKIFMDASTGNMLIRDENIIRNVINHSSFCSFHAEEANAGKATRFAEDLNKKIYLCHVSSENELEYVKKSRKNVFSEVTPHHLFLTENDQNKFVRMKPPLKTDKDRASLWKAINEGFIDTIGSDHAPHTAEEKRTSEVYGVPGVETRVPLMLDAVNKGRITLEKIVEMMCENPARIFRLENKGFIKEGMDADMVIIDMKLRKKIRNDELFTKCGWSPFEGFEIAGWPVKTIARGNVIFESGEVYDKMKGMEVEFYG